MAARRRDRRSPLRLAASVVAHGTALAALLALGGARLAAIPPDPSLVRGAVAKVEAALGGAYDVTVGDAAWTLRGGTLGLGLTRVRIEGRASGAGVSLDRLVARIGPGGAVRSIHADGVEAALPTARPGPIDLAPLETALRTRLAPAMRAMGRIGLRELRVTGIRAPRAAGGGRQRRLDRPFVFPRSIAIEREGDGEGHGYALTASVRMRDATVPFTGTLGAGGDVFVTGERVPLSAVWSSDAVSTDAALGITLSAGPGSASALDLVLDPAPLRLGGETARLAGARLRAVIDEGRVRVVRAEADVGGNAYALNGLVEAFRTDTGAPAALFTLASDEVTLAPADIGAGPLSLAVALSGSVDLRTREIALGTIALDGEGISARGTARVDLRRHALALDLTAPRADAATLPTVWPSWIAGGARGWLATNVSAGTVTDARLALDLGPGRLRTLSDRPLTADEIDVAARIEGASTTLFGELPPLSGAEGTLRYRGTQLSVALEGGEVRTSRGAVPLAASTFTLDTSSPDLPASFDLALSGEATALGALADAAPIGALAKAGFAADELTGRASGRLTGTIALKAPERRDWALDLDLDRVALLRALEGRRLADITGSLRAAPDRVRLDAAGTLDGMRARFDVIEPIPVPAASSIVSPAAFPMPDAPVIERVRRVTMTLDRKGLATLSPALAELVGGTLDVAAKVGEGRIEVTADLKDASLSLPWVGWSKGRGVAGTVRFTAVPGGGGFRVEDLDVDGPGFRARGSAVIDAHGLAALTLDRAALARNDDLRVKLVRKGEGFDIDVRGARADARGILAALDPRNGKGAGSGGSSTPVSVRARIATVRGHGGVEANGVDVTYRGGAGGLERVALRAALPGGRQLVVDGSTAGGRSDVFVTTDDAGTTLRFLDLYGRMRGGVLTASFGRRGQAAWTGDVAASGIEIHDEPKLRVMASKVSRRGRIDGSRVRLARAEVGVTYDDGTLRFTDGIVRGPEVGAVFAGTLIDAQGRIALTGTFLPAYGLNRIFGEVPVLGAVLGNGRDKGLIGITFRLSGQTRRPTIEVNPLSAMAPGVFRRVFEYR